jgi:GGDEF domain-containing protein
LRRSTRGRAVVARVGGEEFLIAEATQPGEAEIIAERLRQEVAAIPRGATASVGVASIRRVDIGVVDARAVIEHLVDTADAVDVRGETGRRESDAPGQGHLTADRQAHELAEIKLALLT